MKKLVLALVVSVFVPTLAFGDVPNIREKVEKIVSTTVKVQGLKNGKTANGSVLVLVIDAVNGRRTVTKVQNNVSISKGYKFNQARLFFVSADLLKDVGNNITKIDFDNNDSDSLTSFSAATIFKGNPISPEMSKGFSVAPIELPPDLWVDNDSPVSSRVITYTIK